MLIVGLIYKLFINTDCYNYKRTSEIYVDGLRKTNSWNLIVFEGNLEQK